MHIVLPTMEVMFAQPDPRIGFQDTSSAWLNPPFSVLICLHVLPEGTLNTQELAAMGVRADGSFHYLVQLAAVSNA